LPNDYPFWQTMKRIWADREPTELTPRSTEEVEAQRRALRDDVEVEIEKAVRLQAERGHVRPGAAEVPRENP
jgi:hypothetical protein